MFPRMGLWSKLILLFLLIRVIPACIVSIVFSNRIVAEERIISSIAETARLIEEVAASGVEIESEMDNILLTSREQTTSMQQIASSADSVATMSEEMSTLIAQFKIKCSPFKLRLSRSRG